MVPTDAGLTQPNRSAEPNGTRGSQGGAAEYPSSVLSGEARGLPSEPANVRVHSQVEFTPLAVPVLRAAGRRPVISTAGWGVLVCSLIPPSFL